MKVAIVMPVYNSGKYLRKTIQSILDQTYSDWRLLAIDDGSTDDSVEILKSFTDPRIMWKSNSGKKGPAGARNNALDVVRSAKYMQTANFFDLVAYCDSDDKWDRDHLKTAVSTFAVTQCDMTYSDCDFENERGEKVTTWGVPYYEDFNIENLRKQNFIYISTVVHRADIECSFDTSCVPMEDYDMWLQIANVSQGKRVKHIKKVTATYLFKDGGSYYTSEQSAKSMEVVHAKHSLISLAEKKEGLDFDYVEGWLTLGEGRFLSRLGSGGNCLEIGSFKGKSACYIASTAKSVVCVDPFKADSGGQAQRTDHTTLSKFLDNTKDFDNIRTVIGKSSDVYDQFKDESFDMIFIDGMHDFESVEADILNYWPKLKVGGSMCFHDYQKDWPGVIQAVDGYFGQPDKICDSVAAITKMQKELPNNPPVRKSKKLDSIMEGKLLLMKSLLLSSADVDKLTYFEFDNLVSEVSNKKLSEKPEQTEVGRVISKVVLIAPWSHKLPNGKENPKNFPLATIVKMTSMLKDRGFYTIQIGVPGEPIIGADEMVLNASFERLKTLLDKADTFISVDSFFPHFANYYGRSGVVLFSQSDPKLFGYPSNLNLLKQGHLRKNQFWLWTQADYDPDAYLTAEDIVDELVKNGII